MINTAAPFIIVTLIILEGLFSGGEIALVSSDINKIRQKANSGSLSAHITLKLLNKPEWFLATTLTGTNLCVVVNTAFATSLFIAAWGPARGELLSVVTMIPLLLVLGEIVPKSIFQQHSEAVALKLSWFILVTSWIFYPVVLVISKISRGAVSVVTKREDILYSPYITKSGLSFLLQDNGAEGDIMQSERDMIQRIFSFPDSTADNLMMPLSTIIALPEEASLTDAAAVFNESGFSRVPVYKDKILNITGLVHSFELLEALSSTNRDADTITVGSIARRDPLYVPKSKHASELLFEMQRQNRLTAIVVDEYGGAVGIVTMEDLIEEIVGEIDDEAQNGNGKPYRKVGPNRYLFPAQTKIDFFTAHVPLDISESNFETLGGFLLQRMGRIPRRRETYREGGIIFIIDDADLKSIKDIVVVLPPGTHLAD